MVSQRRWAQAEKALDTCPICRGQMLLIRSDGSDCRISRECRRWFYLRCMTCNLLFGYEPDRGGVYDPDSLPELVRDWNEGTARPVRVRVLVRPITLAAARVNAGLTQREVAKTLGVSASCLCSMEHGHYPMTAQDFKKLAKIYGVETTQLVLPSSVETVQKKRGYSFLSSKAKEARKIAGLTQCQVALHLGKSQSAINAYETGRYIPKKPDIKRMAKLYGTEPDQLMEATM